MVIYATEPEPVLLEITDIMGKIVEDISFTLDKLLASSTTCNKYLDGIVLESIQD